MPPDAPPCTVTVAPGEDIVAHLVEGAVICLAAGTHKVPGGLFIERSLTLRGEPGAVLDAGGRGSVVHIVEDGLTVRISGLLLTGGHAELGAGLRLEGDSALWAEDLAVRGNAHTGVAHAGIGALRGSLHLRGARFEGSDGLWLSGVVDADLVDCTIEGPLTLREEANVRVEGGVLGGAVSLRGTTTRAPTLTLVGVRAPGLDNDAALPGKVVREKRRRP